MATISASNQEKMHKGFLPLLPAGYRLSVIDGSSIEAPGADGTDYRLHLRLDLVSLTLLELVVTDVHTAESLRHFTLSAGDIALVDRGYCQPAALVETAPVETSLDNPDLPEAWQSWVEMFDGAKSTIDLSHFYASNEPGSCLEFVVQALERAADRGVRIRAIFDRGFYERTYRDPIDRLKAYLETAGELPEVFQAELAGEADALGERVRTQVRAMPKPPADSMFEHVYATPHAVVDGEREAFARYEASFLDTEEAHR